MLRATSAADHCGQGGPGRPGKGVVALSTQCFWKSKPLLLLNAKTKVPFKEALATLTWDTKMALLESKTRWQLPCRKPWRLADVMSECQWAHWVNLSLSQSNHTYYASLRVRRWRNLTGFLGAHLPRQSSPKQRMYALRQFPKDKIVPLATSQSKEKRNPTQSNGKFQEEPW